MAIIKHVRYDPDPVPAAVVAVVDSYDAFRFSKYHPHALVALFALAFVFVLWQLARACWPKRARTWADPKKQE